MGIKFNIDTGPVEKILKEMERGAAQLPNRLHNILQGKEGRIANRALTALSKTPPPPVYPIRWKSVRQRRAFFASGGFGRGIPSRRDGTLQTGWRVVYTRTQDGGLVALTNPVSYMQFVQGDFAQPFHLDTGWVQRDDVKDDFLREAGAMAVAAWQTATGEVIKVAL